MKLSKGWIKCLALTLCVSPVLHAEPEKSQSLSLVTNGKASCVIVTNSDPKQGRGPEGESPLWQNLLDFQRIMEKMSGARIPIVTVEEAKAETVKICVGNVPLPKWITVDETRMKPRGYCIIAARQTLVLRGKTEGGTVNALYGFLQDKFGVRWCFPTELFEVVPTRKTVSIPFCNEVHNPSFEYSLFTADSGLSDAGQRWCERLRRDVGAFRLRADPHYLGYILNSDLYGKTHPEFYPLLNGKRVIPPPGDRSAPQPCLSNPDMVKAVVDFCRKSFDENPNLLNVAIGRNDSTIWCECEKCKAMDFLPLEKVNDMEQHSDRYFAFANQVAREIAKSHPGKLVGCLVYNDTFLPPGHLERIEPNIAIALCVDDSQYYDKTYQARDYEVLEAWKKKGCKHVILYNYPGLCWWWAPRYYPHQDAAHMKEMFKRGVEGWYGGFQGYWATQGPMFYQAARLMWDVNLDPDKVLDEFFTGLFGREAGREMQACYDVFEEAWKRSTPGRSGKYFEGWSSMREQMVPYRMSYLEEAMAHLDRAKKLPGEDLARRRINYIADSFSYAALAMRGWLTSDMIDRLKASDLTKAAKAEALKGMLLQVSQALKDEETVYQRTLLVDPISNVEGKDGHTGHFGIIRGQWPPRCRYSLTNGTALLLEHYRKNKMTEEAASLRKELPADIVSSAEAISAETLGEELIQNGKMETGTPPAQWQPNNSKLSAAKDCHSGGQSLRISASADAGSAFQVFAVKPNTRYRIDFWFKCSRPGALYTYVNAHGEQTNSFGESKEDTEWTHLTATFMSPKRPEVTAATVGFCSWPGKDTLVDDVSIREVKTANQMECRKVDVGFPDWSNPTFVLDSIDRLGNYGDAASKWRGPGIFSASACLGWDESGLHLAVKAKDADHDQPYKGEAIWQGDSLQFGIDAGADAEKRAFGTGYDDANDFLYGLSLSERQGAAPELYRWHSPKGKPIGDIPNGGKSHKYGVTVEKGYALYDFRVSWNELGVTPRVGDKIGLNLVVFDLYRKEQDKRDVLTWLQLTAGIAGSEGQSPSLWRKFVFVK